MTFRLQLIVAVMLFSTDRLRPIFVIGSTATGAGCDEQGQ